MSSAGEEAPEGAVTGRDRETTDAAASEGGVSAESVPAQRRPVVVRCAGWEQVAELFTHNIRDSGLFLRTADPPPPGTLVPLHVRFPDARTVSLQGHVVEVMDGERRGMMLSFPELDSEAIKAFEEALVRVAAERDQRASRSTHEYSYMDSSSELAHTLSRSPADRRLRGAYYVALAREARERGHDREASIHLQTAIHFDASYAELWTLS